MNDQQFRLREAKDRLRIPDLWTILNLRGDPPRRGIGVCRSPFRQDRNASFSIFDEGRRWKDQATGEGGTAVDFLMKAEGLDLSSAIRRFRELAGVPLRERRWTNPSPRPRTGHPDVSFLRTPSRDEICAIAKLRRLSADSVTSLACCGILKSGIVDGFPVWGIVDGPPSESPRVAEVRRLDGELLPVSGNSKGAKGKSLWGSCKDWPVGASRLKNGTWTAVLLCEGMPDLLAAAHFSFLARRYDLCPVTILGRSNGHIHPAAIELLSGRRIRIFPHADRDGGGVDAAKRWAATLPGTKVDWFDFSGLRRFDNEPVNDLNDCAEIHPDDAGALDELLP